nr:radical SAM protein [Candidatus Sigynarchaeota archaeon]
GGPWPSVEYSRLLEEHAADVVVIGEGERVIVELVEAIAKGQDLSNIRGIAYIIDNKTCITERQDFIENLDELPFPAWELFPEPKRYAIDSKGGRFFPVMTSRGCPYDCVNCTKYIHGYKIRKRSPENVIMEIKYLRNKFRADEIIIIDDNFNQDIERAEKILDGISQLDFKIHLRFSNGLRADKITPRLAWKLKAAGAYQISLGIESGDQSIVDALKKKLQLNHVSRAIKLLKMEGIKVVGFFMVGLPWDTLHSLIATKRFIQTSNLDHAYLFKVLPVNGTVLFDILAEKAHHIERIQRNMMFYSYEDPLFEIDGLPNELVSLAIQDISRIFYFSFKRVLDQLRELNLHNWRWLLSAFVLTFLRVFRSRNKEYPGQVKERIIKKLKKK